MPSGAMHYHDLTSYDRHAMSPHTLDWANQPTVSKVYPGLDTVPLPRIDLPETPNTGEVLLRGRPPKPGAHPSSLQDLARILTLACSPTAVMRHPSGDQFFRSIPSAGALYPTEIYLAGKGFSGLQDGLYHYAPLRGLLHRLRRGDLFPAADQPALRFFLSAIFFRSAWKYRARSYRYHLLDTGHAVEAIDLSLYALGWPRAVGVDFDDDGIDRLLGLDTTREAALAWVDTSHGADKERVFTQGPPLPDPVRQASRVSPREVDYPEVREIHERGKTVQPARTKEASDPMVFKLGPAPRSWEPLPTCAEPFPQTPYADTVSARRSSRNFARQPVSAEAFFALSAMLCADQDEAAPRKSAPPHAVVGSGLLAGRIEGSSPGLYLLDPLERCLGRARGGDLTASMAHSCLEQGWLAGAALHVLFMADLELLDRVWGARGYRYAMLSAGRLAHRIYLCATALGLGCCGIGAFFDSEVQTLLGLNDTSRLLYLVAAGPVQGGLRSRNGRGR